MNLYEAFKQLNSLTEETNAAQNYKYYQSYLAKQSTLEAALNAWDVDQANTARNKVRDAANELLAVIPTNTRIDISPVVQHIKKVDAANKATSSSTLANNVRKALRTRNGLTFTVNCGDTTLYYFGVSISDNTNGVIRYDKYSNQGYLDLKSLAEYIDEDRYSDDIDFPDEYRESDLIRFARYLGITNYHQYDTHFWIPMGHKAITYLEPAFVNSVAKLDPVFTREDFDKINEFYHLLTKTNVKVLESLRSGSWWLNQKEFEALIKNIKITLETRQPKLVAYYGTDELFKAIAGERYEEAANNFIDAVNDYLADFAEYDELVADLNKANDGVNRYRTRLQRTRLSKADRLDNSKEGRDNLNAVINFRWEDKIKAAEDLYGEFKSTIDDKDALTIDNWYALGWLARHVKKLRIYGPEELANTAAYKNINYDITTPLNWVSPQGYPNFAASGSIILDTNIGECLEAETFMKELAETGNLLRANHPNSKYAGLVPDTKPVTSETRVINSLYAAHYLVENDFECSKSHEKLRQDPEKIAPLKSQAAQYKAFYMGYNAGYTDSEN